MDGIKQLGDWIRQAESIVFFGGAGVSTESGLKDFRGEDGLDKMKSLYSPEEVLSRRFFYAHTEAQSSCRARKRSRAHQT